VSFICSGAAGMLKLHGKKRVLFEELIGVVEDVPCVMWDLEVNTLLKWIRHSSLLWFKEF
jgi:hypothetical protein